MCIWDEKTVIKQIINIENLAGQLEIEQTNQDLIEGCSLILRSYNITDGFSFVRIMLGSTLAKNNKNVAGVIS